MNVILLLSPDSVFKNTRINTSSSH